jgi:thiopeptide-type bacteriocin biosynthesis protein
VLGESIIRLCKQPLAFEVLREKLLKLFPELKEQEILLYLQEWIQNGYLISDSSSRALLSLEREEWAFKELAPDIDIPYSDEIREAASKYENTLPGAGEELLGKLRIYMDKLHKSPSPYRVDAFQDADNYSLPICIQDTLQTAVSLLLRLGQENKKKGVQYRSFVEKFGVYRLVPAREYFDFAEEISTSQEAYKDNNLSLISSLFQGVDELDLEKSLNFIPELTKEDIAKAPPSLELFFELGAASLEALGEGRYKILVTGVSDQAGATFGRFLPLCKPWVKEQITSIIRQEERLYSDVVFVEATFLPTNLYFGNVTQSQRLRAFSLHMEYHEKGENVLEVGDVFVGANSDCLYLYCPKVGKEIRLTLQTAINPKLAPPILKTLLDISRARYQDFGTTFWAQFNSMTFTPRIRYQNIVLSPKTWRINERVLGKGSLENFDKLISLLKILFEQLNVPERFYLVSADRKLMLSKNIQAHWQILVESYQEVKEILITETVFAEDEKVIRNEEKSFVSEFIVPFVKNHAIPPTPSIGFFPSIQQIPQAERIFIPGSRWTYVKIYLPSIDANSFLLSKVLPFAQQLHNNQDITKWFYIRYLDDKHHLRLRIESLKPAVVITKIYEWANMLVNEGRIADLSLGSYEREIERYGGPGCIEVAETFFWVDSIWSLRLLKGNNLSIPLFIEAAFTIVRFLKGFGLDIIESLRLLEIPETQKDLLNGLRPYNQIAMARLSETHREELDLTLHQFGNCLREAELAKALWTPKEEVINSLIHLHCNRLLGTDPDLERRARVAAFHFLSKQKAYHATNK